MEKSVKICPHHNRVNLYKLFTVDNISSIFFRGLPQIRTSEDKFFTNDFWEFFYVDRGSLYIELESNLVSLSAGEGIFYPPYSLHRLAGSDSKAVNVLTLAFDCTDLDKDFFSNKIFSLNSVEKNILSKIMKAGNLYFERYSNDPFGEKGIKLKEETPCFAVPFVKASIEYFLLLLYVENALTNLEIKATKLDLSPQIRTVVEYMYQNVYKNLTLNNLATIANMSASQFRMLFKKETAQSVMDFFTNLKIEQAKILIRENIYSFDEIAQMLNYSSSSYFSRQFKQKTNMTPTEYSRLVNSFALPDEEKNGSNSI